MVSALLAISLLLQQPDPWPPLVARAREVVDRLVSGEVEPLLLHFTDKMKAAIDADGLRRLMPGLIAQFGAFKSQTGVRTESAGGLRIVLVSCAFERADLELRVAFDSFDRIGGIGFRPPAPAVAYTPPPYVTPAAFRDEAVTVDAGGWPLPGTLSTPVGDGPFPGVVLVHGSGPNDRDESLGPNKVLSVPDAIGIALEQWWRDKQGVQQEMLPVHTPPGGTPIPSSVVSVPVGQAGQAQTEMSYQAYNGGETFMGTCPDCGSQLEYAEGCVKCHVCGFSECG